MKPRKPTRAEYIALLRANWPGATCIEGRNKQLYVSARSAEMGMAISFDAKDAGLKTLGVLNRGPYDFLVRIYGFSTAKGKA